MLDFREHKKYPNMLSDLLPWAALIAPEVVLNKDGSFMSTIKYRGPDLDSSTEDELIVKAAHVNNILRRLGSNWALYSEAQRVTADNYPSCNYPEIVSYLIDENRKKAFSKDLHFESFYYLTLIYIPPTETVNKIESMLLSRTDSNSAVNYENLLDNFILEINRVVDLLARIFPQASVIKDNELLTYLHSTISPKRHPVNLPENPCYLDSILADTPLTSGFFPMLGEYYIGVVSIMAFPSFSFPGILDALNHLALEYRYSTRFICLDKVDAKKELEDYQRKWFSKRKGMMTLIKELLTKEDSAISDSDALSKAQDAQQAVLELGTDEISYGYYTSQIILLEKDEEKLRANAAIFERVINSLGFTSRIETVNAVDAWLSSIPGNTQRNVRRPLLNTINLSHLLPGTSAVWSGDIQNKHLGGPAHFIAETAGNTPFRFNTHVGDVGHTLILGPTGSGKSTLLNFLEVQFLKYPNAQVYIFDKGASAYTLTTAVGGDYYDLGAEDSELFFQPLAYIDNPSEMKWAQDWLLAIAEAENIKITPDVKKTIWEALENLASGPQEQKTLYSFVVFLQNKELRDAFEPYTKNGAYGKLLDNKKDNLKFSKWQCFEMERLMDTPTIIGPVLSYIFMRLQQRFDGSPTLLVLDEAWLFLDHPVFANKIREWLKTLRKLNVSVVFATQSLADVDSSSIAPTIKEACFTKVYLPNSVALQPDAAEFYKRFGLNQRQVEILAYSTPKQDYYYTSPYGNRIFDLALDEIALAYCAGVSRERIELVKRIRETTDDVWDFNRLFLKELGLTEYSDFLHKQMEDKKVA